MQKILGGVCNMDLREYSVFKVLGGDESIRGALNKGWSGIQGEAMSNNL